MLANNLTRFAAPLRQPRVALLLLCFAAFVLRLFHLDAQSLWYDEGFSAWLAAQSFDQIIARTAADIHPPLYYFVLHVWIALCGNTEFALRFLSLAPGVLLVPAVFLLARRLLDATTAWIAALLVVVSPLYVWYAQEARMYAWLTLLTVFSSYCCWRWTERATRGWWLAWTACNALAVYLHFYGFFIVAFQLIYFFIWWVRQETRWGILLSGLASVALVGAVYVPWARVAVTRLSADESYFEGTLSISEVLRKTVMMFSVGHSMTEADALLPALIFVALAGLGWLAARRLRRDPLAMQDDNPFRTAMSAGAAARLYLLLYLVTPFVLLYLISYARPKFHPRYLLIASPPFYILIAAGLAIVALAFWRSRGARVRRRLVTATFATLAVALIFTVALSALVNLYFDPRFSKDDFRGVVAAIKANRANDEPSLLVSGHMFPVYTYYDPMGQYVPLPPAPTLSTQRLLGYNVANDLNTALTGKRGAWLVLWQNDVVDPAGFVTTILDTQAKRVPVLQSFWGVDLLHYQIPPGVVFSDQPQIQKTVGANFGGQLTLLGYNAPKSPSPSDKGLSITLYWRAQQNLQKDYQVALRVRDADGHLVGELDARPATYTYPTNRWQAGDVLFGNFVVPLELATPPGDYQLDVSVYAADTKEALDVVDIAGNGMGQSVTLQPLAVDRATVQPTLTKLKPKHNTHFNFANTVEMFGFDVDRDRAEPGEAISVTLYWRALTTPKDDYRVAFQVLRGANVEDTFGGDPPVPLVTGYPTTSWRQGDIVRARYTFYVPTDAQPGDRAFRLLVLDRSSKPLSAAVGLGDLHIDPSTRAFRPPPVRIVDVARFGGTIQLYGYDIAPAPVMTSTVAGVVNLSPSQPLKVTLYWRSLQRVRASYSVFIHLLREAASPVAAQRDGVPVNGQHPTNTWVPGEFIADSYDITLPRDMPRGTYIIEVGLYDPRTGGRLPLQATSTSNPSFVSAWPLGVKVVVR